MLFRVTFAALATALAAMSAGAKPLYDSDIWTKRLGGFFATPQWFPQDTPAVSRFRTYGSAAASNATHRIDNIALAAANATFEGYFERVYRMNNGKENVLLWPEEVFGPNTKDEHFAFGMPTDTNYGHPAAFVYQPDTNRVIYTRRLNEFTNFCALASAFFVGSAWDIFTISRPDYAWGGWAETNLHFSSTVFDLIREDRVNADPQSAIGLHNHIVPEWQWLPLKGTNDQDVVHYCPITPTQLFTGQTFDCLFKQWSVERLFMNFGRNENPEPNQFAPEHQPLVRQLVNKVDYGEPEAREPLNAGTLRPPAIRDRGGAHFPDGTEMNTEDLISYPWHAGFDEVLDIWTTNEYVVTLADLKTNRPSGSYNPAYDYLINAIFDCANGCWTWYYGSEIYTKMKQADIDAALSPDSGAARSENRSWSEVFSFSHFIFIPIGKDGKPYARRYSARIYFDDDQWYGEGIGRHYRNTRGIESRNHTVFQFSEFELSKQFDVGLDITGYFAVGHKAVSNIVVRDSSIIGTLRDVYKKTVTNHFAQSAFVGEVGKVSRRLEPKPVGGMCQTLTCVDRTFADLQTGMPEVWSNDLYWAWAASETNSTTFAGIPGFCRDLVVTEPTGSGDPLVGSARLTDAHTFPLGLGGMEGGITPDGEVSPPGGVAEKRRYAIEKLTRTSVSLSATPYSVEIETITGITNDLFRLAAAAAESGEKIAVNLATSDRLAHQNGNPYVYVHVRYYRGNYTEDRTRFSWGARSDFGYSLPSALVFAFPSNDVFAVSARLDGSYNHIYSAGDGSLNRVYPQSMGDGYSTTRFWSVLSAAVVRNFYENQYELTNLDPVNQYGWSEYRSLLSSDYASPEQFRQGVRYDIWSAQMQARHLIGREPGLDWWQQPIRHLRFDREAERVLGGLKVRADKPCFSFGVSGGYSSAWGGSSEYYEVLSITDGELTLDGWLDSAFNAIPSAKPIVYDFLVTTTWTLLDDALIYPGGLQPLSTPGATANAKAAFESVVDWHFDALEHEWKNTREYPAY